MSFACPPVGFAKASVPVTFGAIRWDAWYGTNANIADQTAATLSWTSPIDYSARSPAHANQSTNPQTWGDNQTTFDAEITAAVTGGLDYFIFTTGTANNFGAALAYYMASSKKNQIKFCSMASSNNMGSTGNFTTQINAIVTTMGDTQYMKVNGRPLLFIYMSTTDIANFWGGSNSNFVTMITALRAAAITASLLSPYIVTMGGGGDDHTSTATFSVDAVTNYAVAIPTGVGAPFATLAAGAESYWTTVLTASAIVPICMSGWDPSPRNQHPESFASYEGANWFIAPQISDLAVHLTAARRYIQNNRARCPANTAIVYAWNEYDEGHSVISPTVAEPTGSVARAFNVAKVNMW